MTAATSLIQSVRRMGGEFAIEGERVRVSLPDTPDGRALAEQLRLVRDEIVDALRMPAHEPDARREDFARWVAQNCIHREGRDDWGGIGVLYVNFAEWCVWHDSTHCERCTFEWMLEDAGFRCKEGMAAGLLLKVDLEAVLRFQGAAGSGTPAANPGLPVRIT